MIKGRITIYRLICICVISSLALAGCTMFDDGGNKETSSIEQPTKTSTFIAVNATKTASVTPSPTNTFPPTSTPTFENLELTPTLPPSQHGEYILNLIAANEDCYLPCIFGITPGKTTYSEVRRLFQPVQPMGATPVRGIGGMIDVSLYMSEKSYQNFFIQMEEEENIINIIRVSGIKFLQDDPYYIKEFAEALEKYSPENVLGTYGVPTRVYMNLQEPAAGDVIDLLIFYDDLGFFLHYVFSDGIDRDKQTGFLNVCPEYKYLEIIHFYMQSAKNTRALERLDPMIASSLYIWYLPLDELTELSLEDFHRIIVEKENDGCFVSP